MIAGVLCLLLAPVAARGEWLIGSSEEPSPPNGSVVYHRVALTDDETTTQATLDCVIFPAKEADLEVIDQPEPPRQDLAEIMRRNGALAGVNGGYFDPDDAPMGLLVSRGRTISPLRKAKLLSGVLFATRDRIDVVRRSNLTMNKKIRAAVQCGPLLVERGAPVGGLNDSRRARRTFAAVDGDGHVALGVCSAVSLAELGRILAIPHALGKMKTARALNLDGGSSSAFWFAGETGAVSRPELKTVRDFIAVLPKKNR